MLRQEHREEAVGWNQPHKVAVRIHHGQRRFLVLDRTPGRHFLIDPWGHDGRRVVHELARGRLGGSRPQGFDPHDTEKLAIVTDDDMGGAVELLSEQGWVHLVHTGGRRHDGNPGAGMRCGCLKRDVLRCGDDALIHGRCSLALPVRLRKTAQRMEAHSTTHALTPVSCKIKATRFPSVDMLSPKRSDDPQRQDVSSDDSLSACQRIATRLVSRSA